VWYEVGTGGLDIDCSSLQQLLIVEQISGLKQRVLECGDEVALWWACHRLVLTVAVQG